MSCMSFKQLLNWTRTEHDERGSVFGVRNPYIADSAKTQTIFTRNLETPIGPAAGPNSQLAQNIAASYYAGSRFFELKTVQIMDGAQLAACVNKPCIKADDECYNCECAAGSGRIYKSLVFAGIYGQRIRAGSHGRVSV